MANHGSSFQKILMGAAGSAADPLFVENVFSTFVYTGTGSNITINNGIDLSGEGGLVWVKHRSLAANHLLVDSERGVQWLSTSTTGAQTNQTLVHSFSSNGFTVSGDSVNYASDNGENYVSWTFRKAPKFFDVVTYTGNDTRNTQISHNLGSVPGMIIVKKTSASGFWPVYHRGLTSSDYYLRLNETNAEAEDGTMFDAAPTSTYFTIGDNSNINQNGATYVAYLFAHNNSDGGYGDGADQDIIKCGSFTHSSSTGNTIDLGFEPQWLLVKSATSTIGWYIWDTMRGWTVVDQANLQPNSSGAESTGSNTNAGWPQITNTGFRVGTNSNMGDNKTFIYMAIRRGPMATPTAASDVFNVVQTTNADPAYVSGFPTDFALWRETGSDAWRAVDRLRGNPYLQTHGTNAENADTDQTWDYMNGHYQSYISSSYYSWMWRRAPGYFDVVAYTGNSTAGRTVSHNLGVTPEMMWVKRRNSSTDWRVYHKDTGNTHNLKLNSTAVKEDALYWNDTTPTNTVFTLNNFGDVNGSGQTYIAYLFATLAGVSKVGSVTHSGTTNVDCGFSSGAKFVLLKRTDSTGDWFVWDSTRGIIAGNDPYLLLNSNAGHVTNTDYIDPLSSGFTIASSFSASGTYIFYAIAA